MSKRNVLTRREFIRNSSVAAAGAALLPGLAHHGQLSAEPALTKVALARDKDVFDKDLNIRPKALQALLDSAVTALTGQRDPIAAFKTFIKPSDIVGVKSNWWSQLRTPPEMEQALKKRVMDAGVAEGNISIRDWSVLEDPIFQKSTALINVRPMRSHHWSGVGSLIKNYILFVEKPFEWHNDSCADLAGIWKLPIVKDKTRLNVLLMLTPQFHGVGPHSFSPKYVWPYFGVLAGFDPVAVDSVGLRIIEAKRKEYFKEERPLNPPAKHILLADSRHKLGTADPDRIQIIRIGYGENSLI